MSESSGESAYTSSNKYRNDGWGSSSESQYDYHHTSSRKQSVYEGRNNDAYNKNVNLDKNDTMDQNKRIVAAKTILKAGEEEILRKANQNDAVGYRDEIKGLLRDLVVHNESIIIASPTYNTVYELYQHYYDNLKEEEKQKPMHKIIHETLKNKAIEEKRENSLLKYW